MVLAGSTLRLFVCLLAGFFACGPQVSTANGIQMTFQSVATGANGTESLSDSSGAEGAPQRVDYRDRNRNATDLGLLGAATGMCSYSDDCDFCAYRETNPCQVADRYGANTTLCQVPGFLGGTISEDALCAMGATTDVYVDLDSSDSGLDGSGSSGTSSGDGSGSVAASTLTVFRTREGLMVVTITTRCGWLLVPSQSYSQSQSQLTVLEGNATYNSLEYYFAVPSQLQQQQEEDSPPPEQAASATPSAVERYSCFSASLPLQGLVSSCQALELDLKLRLAFQRVELVDPGTPPPAAATATNAAATVADGPSAEEGDAAAEDDAAEAGEGAAAELVCEASGRVYAADVELHMKPPQAGQRVKAAVAAATEAASSDSLQQQEEEIQQLFSYGVGATASYTATLDPRISESASWLDSVSSQAPLVTTTPTHQSLSFFVGVIQQQQQQQAPVSSSGVAPLLPYGLTLNSCSRQSISEVAAAVVAVLASQGVTIAHVADVLCLPSPYSAVPTAELPACARDTSILFNVSLEMPLGSSASSSVTTSSTSSPPSSALYSSSTSTSSTGNGTDPADPRVLADTLARASFAAPWACLSAESQMRMALELHLALQIPKGPGVEASSDMTSSLLPPPPFLGSIVLRPSPPASDKSPNPQPPDSSTAPSAAGTSSDALPTAVVVAVVMASVLAVLVAVAGFFAVRSAARAKAAERVVSALAAGGALGSHAAAAAAAARVLGKGSGAGPGAGASSGKVMPAYPVSSAPVSRQQSRRQRSAGGSAGEAESAAINGGTNAAATGGATAGGAYRLEGGALPEGAIPWAAAAAVAVAATAQDGSLAAAVVAGSAGTAPQGALEVSAAAALGPVAAAGPGETRAVGTTAASSVLVSGVQAAAAARAAAAAAAGCRRAGFRTRFVRRLYRPPQPMHSVITDCVGNAIASHVGREGQSTSLPGEIGALQSDGTSSTYDSGTASPLCTTPRYGNACRPTEAGPSSGAAVTPTVALITEGSAYNLANDPWAAFMRSDVSFVASPRGGAPGEPGACDAGAGAGATQAAQNLAKPSTTFALPPPPSPFSTISTTPPRVQPLCASDVHLDVTPDGPDPRVGRISRSSSAGVRVAELQQGTLWTNILFDPSRSRRNQSLERSGSLGNGSNYSSAGWSLGGTSAGCSVGGAVGMGTTAAAVACALDAMTMGAYKAAMETSRPPRNQGSLADRGWSHGDLARPAVITLSRRVQLSPATTAPGCYDPWVTGASGSSTVAGNVPRAGFPQSPRAPPRSNSSGPTGSVEPSLATTHEAHGDVEAAAARAMADDALGISAGVATGASLQSSTESRTTAACGKVRLAPLVVPPVLVREGCEEERGASQG